MPKTATERAGASLASFGITPELMVGCDRCGTDHRADQFRWVLQIDVDDNARIAAALADTCHRRAGLAETAGKDHHADIGIAGDFFFNYFFNNGFIASF